MKEITIEDIEARLGELLIFELRQTARAVGVLRPAEGKKFECIKRIIEIAKGEVEPVPCENPVGTKMANKQLVKDILDYRKSVLGK